MTEPTGRPEDRMRAFASSFVIKEKRARFVQIASPGRQSPTKRSKYGTLIAGLEYWLSPGRRLDTPHASNPGPELAAVLEELGAPSRCYVMSLGPDDGCVLELRDILTQLTFGASETRLLICRPSSLAYYWHGEAIDLSAVLLARTPNPDRL